MDDVNQTDASIAGLQFSPLGLHSLVLLFVRPTRFFSSQLALGRRPYVVLVAWCYGAEGAILAPVSVEIWLDFWLSVLASGAVMAVLAWYLGGWWYRVRLMWAGARAPDKRQSRLLLMYASLVHSGPTVLLALAWTLTYPSCAAYRSSGDLSTSIMLPLTLWSLFASYAGARVLFAVDRRRGALWFLILPGLAYGLYYSLILVALGQRLLSLGE